MLLAGITLSYYFNTQYENQAKQGFNKFHDHARNTLKTLELKLQADASSLATNSSIIASLNLIAEYSSISDYQPIIFDKEKWELAKRLSNFARAARIDHIYLQDKNGWLVSFADNNPEHFEEGILGFKNSRPYFITRSLLDGVERQAAPKDKHWISFSKTQDPQTGVITHYKKSSDTGIFIESTYPVFRHLPYGQKTYLGNIVVSKLIDEEYFSAISSDKNIQHLLICETDIKNNPAISPIDYNYLSKVGNLFDYQHSDMSSWFTTDASYITAHSIPLFNNKLLFIISTLNRDSVRKQIHSTQIIILLVFLISSLTALFAGIVFSRRSITQPIYKIISNAGMLNSGSYELEKIETGTKEFDSLAHSLTLAANTIYTRENELRNANIEMESRIQQRTAELREANRDLKEEINIRETIEDRLRESKEMLQKIMDNIPQFIFWKDTELKYLGCNKNFLESSGFSSEFEILGKTDYDMPWTTEEADFYRKVDQRVMSTDTAEYHIQETQTLSSGKKIFVETNKVPLHNADNEVIGILGTYEDITDRKQAELRILQAKEEAESASNAKSHFLSRMSHELRTPLNAILGFAQLLEFDMNHPLDPEQKQNVDEILTAGRHLLELINDILDLSKIEAGTLKLNLRNTLLHSLITESVNLIRNFAISHQVEISVNENALQDLHVIADQVRLKQTLLNLLNNAIKYNQPGGSVTLSVEKIDTNNIKISVTDTGIGIAEDYQERIFTPFDRLGADARAIDGTGIGLVIAKQLVELMQGEIGFTSSPGIGTTFWFTLPITNRHTTQKDKGFESNASISADRLKDLDQKIILCIEDNNANLRLIENIVSSKTPYQLITATSAEEGIELLQQVRPDLILMDITLPGINGIEATGIIKQDDDYKDIPIIAISANAMLSDIQNGLDSGFSGYITKPIDIGIFIETIQNVLD